MHFDKQVMYQAHLLEHLPAAVISTDPAFIILSWNQEAEKLYGWTAKEVVGKHASAFIPPLDSVKYLEQYAKELYKQGFWSGKLTQRHKDGSQIYIEANIKLLYTTDGTIQGILSVHKKIPGINQTEPDFHTEQEYLQATIGNSPVTVSRQDTDLRYTYVFNMLYGYKAENAIGKTDEEALPESLALQVVPIKKRILQTGKGEQHEVSFSYPTGDYTYLLSMEPIVDEQKQIRGLSTVAVNVSTGKSPGAAILQTESQVQKITNALPLLIAYIGADERFKFVNQIFEKWFGKSTETMIGRTLQEVAGDALYSKHKPYFERVMAGETVEYEEVLARQGGDCFLHITLVPYKERGVVHGFYSLGQDQTQLIATKQALEESNQLYKAITYHFPKGNIFLLDSGYNITFAEGGGMRLRGISSETFVGKHVSEFFTSPAQWERHYGYFSKVLEGETVTFTDYVLEQYYEFTATPLPDNAGNIHRILCIIRNITDQISLEEEIKKYTANLQEAQELAKLGFWEYYPAQNKMIWSEMIYKLFNLPASEPIPDLSFFQQLIPPADWQAVLQNVEDATRQETNYQFRLAITLPGGEVKHLQIYGKPMQQTDAGIDRRFGAVMDVTEQYLLEEKVKAHEARLQSLFDSGTVGIIFWELAGAITHANDYFLHLTGYTRQELEAGLVDWQKLTPAEWVEADKQVINAMLASSASVTKEKEYVHKEGRRIPVLLSSTFLEGSRSRGVSFVVDITELRETRRELEEKAQELRNSNAELEKFAYVAAHDLQEPLNTLSGLISLLHYRAEVSTDEEIKKLLNFIPAIIGRMQQLIKNLLEYSRAGSAKLQRQSFSMEEVVKIVIDSLSKRIEDTKTTITYADLPAIIADQPQITQLMQNLLSNAIKFRDTKPMHIEISGRTEPNGWSFSVKDTGIGMDMANAGKIFGAFQRLHTRNEFEGTGIGLAISQKIVERHGGKIWVESQLGVGSTFYFTLLKKETESS